MPRTVPWGARNDVHCVSIEHKMGIKASPTAVLAVRRPWRRHGFTWSGEENRGLEYMFIMMNAARYAVGVQGHRIAERAYQKAATFARERVQSRPVDGLHARQRCHHSSSGRAPHADDHARLAPKGCRALASVAASGLRRRAPPP